MTKSQTNFYHTMPLKEIGSLFFFKARRLLWIKISQIFLLFQKFKYFWYYFFLEKKPICLCFYTPAPRRGRGVYCFTSVRLSVLPSFHSSWTYMHIFLSNYWWQKSDIWSQASYRYPILWEAFLNPSDS